MNERRLERLKQQIKQRLAEVLQRDLADPKLGLVTITRVELDTEFTHCKAYWSVLAGSGQEHRARRDSEAVLTRARGFCQREMARVLHTRTVPRLEFKFDEGIDGAIKINKLLQELAPEGDAESTPETPSPEAPAPETTAPETPAPDADAPGDDREPGEPRNDA